MAAADISSDSEAFASDSGRLRGARSRRFLPDRPPTSKVVKLASSLEDTNRNLRAVDQLLSEYKEIGQRQNGVMDKLRTDLEQTTGRLREERERRGSLRDSIRSLRASDLDDYHRPPERKGRREPTSPLRNYERTASDREYTGFPERRRSRSGVRFYDDMDAESHLHELHQSVRDLTSEQLRLEDDFNREINRRNSTESAHEGHEVEAKKSLREISEKMKNPSTDHAMSTVDKRLQSIQDELRAERYQLKKKQEEVGHLSSELKQALHQQKQASQPPVPGLSVSDENELRSRLSKAEFERNQVASELDKLKRHLDQSEGGRNALIEQIDELRRQVARSEQEKAKLKAFIQEQDAELREHKRHRENEASNKEQLEEERRRLQEEMHSLHSQLSRSAAAIGDLGEVRKELDRSERQRIQLSDHIEVLNKDIESKEKYSAKIISQLQDVTEKYETCEKQRHDTLVQLEDTLKRLREATKEVEILGSELREVKQALSESEHKREDIKTKAQDTVKQWKLKCKKLERDVDRHSHSSQQAVERNEQLLKELEALRSHTVVGGQQAEHLRRQLAELLAIRAEQDEKLRIKDVEVNEMKSLKMDLEKEMQDSKVVIARLEQELHAANNKAAGLFEEKSKLEEQIGAARQGHFMAEQQMQHMQREIKELSLAKVEMSAQLAEMAHERQELRDNLSESRRAEVSSREEIDALMKRLKEEKEFFQSRMEDSKSQMEQIKGKETQIMQEMSRRYKRERAEYEAELQALKIELSDERSSCKLHKKQNEKLKVELDRLHAEVIRAQEDSADVQRNYKKVREEFLEKAQLTEDDLTRARELELQLFDAREETARLTKDYHNTLRTLGAEIDATVNLINAEHIDTFSGLSVNHSLLSDPGKWLAEVQARLVLIKTELRSKQHKEQKMRENVSQVLEETERDRQFYISEISRQNEVLDLLASQTKDIAERDMEKLDKVSRLQEQMEDLVAEKEEAVYRSSQLEHDKYNLMDDLSVIKESQKERDRIHERYAKLQDAMSSLKEELAATRLSAVPLTPTKDLEMRNSQGETTPNGRRKVHIASPPVQVSPTKHLNGILKTPKSPSPLTMTDEEFAARFIPHTPPADSRNDSIL